MELLNQYYKKNNKKCFALRHWLQLKDKKFSFIDALNCIYDAAQGKSNVMDDMINRLTDKKKFFGRTQVYGNERMATNGIDIVQNDNGNLELVGYSKEVPLTPKGQHLAVNPNIVRKTDMQVSKTFKNMEARLNDIGAWVRKQYPTSNVVFIAQAIKNIREYASMHKNGWKKVCKDIENGKLKLNSDGQIQSNKNESIERRVIVITEEMARKLQEENKMTEHKFNSNLRFFLRDLLVDPVNSQLPTEFVQRGYTRSRFIQILLNNGILEKKERISDTDENGEPKKATMMISYKIPKDEEKSGTNNLYKVPADNLKRKIKKLYIKMFERNVPTPLKKKVNEEGEGGMAMSGGATTADASGQYAAPLSGIQRRKIATVEATTTSTNYQYTTPFPGDDATLARHNGEGGSVSVNHKED